MSTRRTQSRRQSLLRCSEEGYWFCLRCERVTEVNVDGPVNCCGLCGESVIVWCPPVAGAAECPACRPEVFDGGWEQVPEAVFCEAHWASAVARVWQSVAKDHEYGHTEYKRGVDTERRGKLRHDLAAALAGLDRARAAVESAFASYRALAGD